MFKRLRRKPRLPNQRRSFGSIIFFLSIPVSFSLGILAVILIVNNSLILGLKKPLWFAFLYGFVAAMALLIPIKLQRVRTFIHELKHAAVVVLTGNKLTGMEIQKHTGHVEYAMYDGRMRFEPFIVLAPYCFPLFTFPAVFIAIFFDQSFHQLGACVVGVAAAIDLETAYRDLHPHQTDLKHLYGGFFLSMLYIAGMNFLWVAVALLWVSEGRNGLLSLGITIFNMARAAVTSI